MDEFLKKIKRRIIIFFGMILIAIALGISYFYTISLENTKTASMEDGIVVGFQLGIILGLGMIALIQVVKLCKAMKDEKQLKILYNKEHDERLKAIRSKAGVPMITITSVFMLIAAIIFGYFNMDIFYALIYAAAGQLTISAAVKLYCLKTM